MYKLRKMISKICKMKFKKNSKTKFILSLICNKINVQNQKKIYWKVYQQESLSIQNNFSKKKITDSIIILIKLIMTQKMKKKIPNKFKKSNQVNKQLFHKKN